MLSQREGVHPYGDNEFVLRVFNKRNLANEIAIARDGEEVLALLGECRRDPAIVCISNLDKGEYEEVKESILKDAPPDAVFAHGFTNSGELRKVPREEW